MNHWTVGKRIIVGFVSVILVAAALGAFAYTRLAANEKEAKFIAGHAMPGVRLSFELQAMIKDQLIMVLQHIGTEDMPEKDGIESRIAATSQAMTDRYAAYEKTMTTKEDREIFDKIAAARKPWTELRGKTVIPLSRDLKIAEAKEAFTNKLIPAFNAYEATLAALVEFNANNGETSSKAIEASVASGKAGILGGIAVAIGLASAVAFAIVRSTTRGLAHISRMLDETAGQVASASGQVSGSSHTLAEGASEQAASLEETSASLEEMASMTRRNAENAQTAKELANQARSVADIGAADMKRMDSAMGEIKAASDNIAKIIKTIDEIAFQTNILALNAAVEAARAGEAGMGFAVVADEVRSLAQRSAQAAKETADKIEDCIRKSENGVQISEKVGHSLNEILGKARQVDELVGEIANASREQSQGIDQVNTALTQMDKVTQSNAASAEESASAAEELNAQAQALKEAVGDLKALVGGAAETAPPAVSKPTRPTAKREAFTSPHAAPAVHRSNGRSAAHGTNGSSKTHHANGTNGTNSRFAGSMEGSVNPSAARNAIPLEDDFKDF